MRNFSSKSIMVLLAISCFGCAEGIETDVPLPDSDRVQQPFVHGGDAADCIEDCSTPFQSANGLYCASFEGSRASCADNTWTDGFYDTIDGKCHKISNSAEKPYTGDVDMIGVEADAGTPLKISATAYDSSRVKPVLTVYDAEGQTLTVSMDMDKDGVATVYMYAPTKDRFYVAVEDTPNYNEGWSAACKGSYSGNAWYGYILKIENDPKTLRTLDLGDIMDKQVYKGHIAHNGEVQYLSWKAPKGSEFSVSLEPKNNTHIMIMSPIDRRNGQYLWKATGSDVFTQKRSLASGYAIESGDNLIFTLAIADEIGHAGYDYTLTIQKK